MRVSGNKVKKNHDTKELKVHRTADINTSYIEMDQRPECT